MSKSLFLILAVLAFTAFGSVTAKPHARRKSVSGGGGNCTFKIKFSRKLKKKKKKKKKLPRGRRGVDLHHIYLF